MPAASSPKSTLQKPEFACFPVSAFFTPAFPICPRGFFPAHPRLTSSSAKKYRNLLKKGIDKERNLCFNTGTDDMYDNIHAERDAAKAKAGNTLEIVRIEKVSFVNEVYKQLRELIVSGTWKEGTKLAGENQLAKSFVANPSNFIHPDVSIHLSVQAYERFIDFRNAVEVSAMKLSVKAATEEDFAHMQACLDAMERYTDDVEKYSQADYEYHLAIVKSAHNEFLERAFLSNQNALTSLLFAMNSLPKSHRFGVDSHALILQDLRDKNIKSIIKRYNEMSEYNLVRLSEFFERQEEKNR